MCVRATESTLLFERDKWILIFGERGVQWLFMFLSFSVFLWIWPKTLEITRVTSKYYVWIYFCYTRFITKKFSHIKSTDAVPTGTDGGIESRGSYPRIRTLHIREYGYIRDANVIMLHGAFACLLTYVRAFIFRGGSSFHHACFLLPRAMLRSYGDVAASLVQWHLLHAARYYAHATNACRSAIAEPEPGSMHALCVSSCRACELASTRMLRLAWTRSREKPHGKSLGDGRLRATIHIHRPFVFALFT